MKHRTGELLAIAAAAAIQFSSASHVESAVQRTWIGTSGLWSGAGNWSPSGSPLAGDQVFLTQGDGTNRIVQYNSVFFPQQPSSVLVINASGSGTMTLAQTGGYLPGDSLFVGTTGQGEYDLNGGSANFTNAVIAANGRIKIGDTNVATLTIGSLTQNNGDIVLASGGTLNILNSYQMNGGTISGSKINSSGTFALNNGMFFALMNNSGTFLYNGSTAGGNAWINNSGTFIYNNPRPFAASIENHGTILFNFDAQLNGIDSFSSFTLPAGRRLTAQSVAIEAGTITQLGNYTGDVNIRGGTWDHRGGQLSTSTASFLAFNISGGTYLLSGTGSLFVNSSSGATRVGYSGNGTFIQSGGSASVGEMIVGGEVFAQGSAGYRGYLSVSGGFLGASGGLTIGPVFASVATFNQSGGSVSTGTLTINENGATTASATISGGTLSASTIHNFGTFTVSGGIVSNTYIDGVGTMSLSGSARLVNNLIRQQSLALAGNAAITKQFAIALTDRVRSLTFDESGGAVHGSWDLGTDHLVIDYSGGSPIAAARRYLTSGRANGQWNGAGLNSSAAAAANPRNRGLGYAEASQLFGASGGLFGSLLVDSSSVLVRYTYNGDTDLNGVIDFDDYARTDSGFNNGGNTWFAGDFDYNGQVNFDDYSLIDLAFNTQNGTLRRAMSYLDGGDRSDVGMDAPSLAIVQAHFARFGEPYAQHFLAAVPEPAELSLTLFGWISASRRRRSS